MNTNRYHLIPRPYALSLFIYFCFIIQVSVDVQAATHERILALSPHVCDILIALHAQKDIVGRVDYCDVVAPLVGDYARLYPEAILTITSQPTLAIAFDAHMQGLDFLRAAGVRVIISHPHRVKEVLDDILRIGKATAHTEQAKVLQQDLRQMLTQLNKKRKKSENKDKAKKIPNIFLELWSNPLITSGKPALLSDVFRYVGARNIFEHLAMESPRVSVEAVLQAAPDIVFITRSSSNNDENIRRVSFWQKWLGAQIPVCIIDFDDLSRPSVRLFAAMQKLQQKIENITRSASCGDN